MGSWMKSIVNQKGTNNLDLAVIYGWGLIKSETGLGMEYGIVPYWHDQTAGCKPYGNVTGL